MNILKKFEKQIGGKTITASFTDLADQADGSVMLACDDTVVMATAVMGNDTSKNPGYFNLTVEYMEKHYATGKIIGGQYMKREGKPTDQAVLNGRIIDRTIRPLFDQRMKNPIQVIVTVLALGDFDPAVLAVNAASIAIATSDIPWNGPVSAVHLSKTNKDGEVKTNRYLSQHASIKNDESYTFELFVCGQNKTINMIESMGYEIPDADVSALLERAANETFEMEAWQKEIITAIGKQKRVVAVDETPAEVVTLFETKHKKLLEDALMQSVNKASLGALIDAFYAELKVLYPTSGEMSFEQRAQNEKIQKAGGEYYYHAIDGVVHDLALKYGKRVDGRAFDQIRSLHASVGDISKRLHGTGTFYRGETHVLSVAVLGSPDDAQLLDGMEISGKKRFMHHYNFPPYSTGETGRIGFTGRREIGHGALVEKAIAPVMPAKEDFPYVVRVVSESTASNGSTSQASVCGSTLALMDAGVPIKEPVAGISMGLMLDEKDHSKYAVLTDIQGPEDHHGDMDFKVAGTKNGITAIQMDVKVSGVPVAILQDALKGAQRARMDILEVITKTIPAPRPDLSPYAPRIVTVSINPEFIGKVIGSGGKTIQKMQEDTDTVITIEEDGTIYIAGAVDGCMQAKAQIEAMTKEWTEGEMAQGTVVKIIEVGAIVEIAPGVDGLVHVSEIADFRVNKVSDVLAVGAQVPVRIVGVDKEKGRISLSIKKADPKFIKNPYGNA